MLAAVIPTAALFSVLVLLIAAHKDHVSELCNTSRKARGVRMVMP
jgi:hypothetical protein